MGGYGSTRWGGTRTRESTDPLLRLDVRWLQRMGALEPGAVFRPHWTCRGEPSGDITTIMTRDRPCLILSYRTRVAGGDWEPIEEPVWLEATSCHFGGERVWFACPGCTSRRAVLYSVGGRFRCRQCHDLAYTSTREDAFARAQRRCDTLQRRFGLESTYGVPWDEMPAKPKGMHQTTYDRLCRALTEQIFSGHDLFMAELHALDARIDKHIQRSRR